MNILIMGLPGSGKGTQSENIVKEFNLGHLSTGDVFRAEMKSGSELGEELNNYIKNGELVPDELTLNILKKEMEKDIYKNGVLLDGFPRTRKQAEDLESFFADLNEKIDAVIFLNVDEEIVIKRLEGRLTCSKCGKIYNTYFDAPKVEGICDLDGAPLDKRQDDELEKIKTRIQIAKEETMPLREFYASNDNFFEVDSEGKNQQEVFEEIKQKLK